MMPAVAAIFKVTATTELFKRDDTPDNLFSPSIMNIFQWIMLSVVCQAIAIFGICTNIINIVCFIKQGFKEPVNVSLLGLAVSDLCSLLTLTWTNLCYTPAFAELDLPFDALEFQYLVSALPHTTFTRVTGWITAVISLERCLCVIAPLKVKSIVTSKRMSTVIIVIFIGLLSSVAPVYVVNRLGLKFYPAKNKTLIGLVFTKDRLDVEKVTFAINNVFIPATSFVVILISTTILVVKLRAQTKWRNKTTTTTQADTISSRNRKVAKMVVMISLLFIICFVPLIILFVALSADTRFSITGKYRNALIVFGGIGIVLESVNSSSNIFIYYHMSSNYKMILGHLFCHVNM